MFSSKIAETSALVKRYRKQVISNTIVPFIEEILRDVKLKKA
jgi:hypothetical protein